MHSEGCEHRSWSSEVMERAVDDLGCLDERVMGRIKR